MSSNESVLVFMRFVKEKHSELIKSLEQLVNALVGENTPNKLAKAGESLKKANDLQSAVSKNDSPSWLPSLVQGLQQYVSKSWNQNDLMNHIIIHFLDIKKHKWVFDNPTEKAFDFDSIYEHYKSESRLPELFNEIIKILEEIEASGEIDSVTMINSLGKVIATLKKNKNSSYFSMNTAWGFLITFLKNYMWAELTKIPFLGTAMTSLEKAIKETNEEMLKTDTAIASKMSSVIETEIKALKGKSSVGIIRYDRSGVKLTSSVEKLALENKK